MELQRRRLICPELDSIGSVHRGQLCIHDLPALSKLQHLKGMIRAIAAVDLAVPQAKCQLLCGRDIQTEQQLTRARS